MIAAIAGLLAFAGDFLVTFVLGLYYPDYNHLKLVMSELGTYQSPVATWVNLWWVLLGILFIVFALGIQAVFARRKKAALIVTVLIVLFGLGAGIGFLGITFVPLVMLILFSRTYSPGFVALSATVLGVGLFSLAFFIASEDVSTAAGILSYPGLGQRLFLLNHYIYLSVSDFAAARGRQGVGPYRAFLARGKRGIL